MAQQPATARNPLDELRDEVKQVLAAAGVPFTEEQEKAIALMMEDRRQASEDLFGQLMDFRAGPVQGQQQDRAVAAIEWVGNEFKKRLREYLTREQQAVWERHEAEKPQPPTSSTEALTTGEARTETQYIRINNNPYTAENPFYGMGNARTEVIQRGGIGAFHGNFAFEFKDESLNARNPFAHNKPAYQERQINLNFNGPVIRNRLTANVSGSQNEQENVDTVHAITPNGLFDLGIVRPFVNRNVNVGGTYQLSDPHSLAFNVSRQTNTRRNQGVGGFSLPERASNGKQGLSAFSVRQFSAISTQTLYETRLTHYRLHDETAPVTDAVSIHVLDAFQGGGSQNKREDERRIYQFGNLFTRMGQKLTLKTGLEGNHYTRRSFSENNFLGTFTFSNLESYLQGIPLNYRVTRGDALLENSQLEMSFFIQNDWKLNQRLTTMLGVRYDYQSNFRDHNNIAPRLGFAYAIGRSTVIRGGVGIFYQWLNEYIVQTQRRLDGTRQYEIVINDPSYPNPFQSGTVTVVPPPSVRVTDPDLAAPYEAVSSISLERSFRNNLFFSINYDHRRGVRQFRSRDLNAPLPGQTVRLDPNRGNILNLESTGMSRSQIFGASFRQRFSVFNVNARYDFQSMYSDNDGAFGFPSNNYDLRSDWGRIGIPGHQINGSLNARLFLGVFLTGSVNANSGGVYNITTGKDDNADTNTNDRPPGVPRNSGDGPRFVSFNFNISKAFFLGKPAGNSNGNAGGSQTNMNVFANMTNAFNRTNYGTPSGVMTSPFFGKPYSARTPREIEIGVRFQF